MIQRIQSVYLFLAAVVILLLFFAPVACGPGCTERIYIYDSVIGIILTLLSAAICLIAIVLFKKRRLQMRTCTYAILMIGFTEAFSFYTAIREGMQWGLVIPPVAMILVVLAFKAIHKDEQLVRSADRLR